MQTRSRSRRGGNPLTDDDDEGLSATEGGTSPRRSSRLSQTGPDWNEETGNEDILPKSDPAPTHQDNEGLLGHDTSASMQHGEENEEDEPQRLQTQHFNPRDSPPNQPAPASQSRANQTLEDLLGVARSMITRAPRRDSDEAIARATFAAEAASLDKLMLDIVALRINLIPEGLGTNLVLNRYCIEHMGWAIVFFADLSEISGVLAGITGEEQFMQTREALAPFLENAEQQREFGRRWRGL